MSIKIKKSEIKPLEARSYQVSDLEIVICNLNDKYYALSNICSHDGGELVSGKELINENYQLECPRHGARFDITTGCAKRMPAVAPIKTYKVIDNGNELEIEVD